MNFFAKSAAPSPPRPSLTETVAQLRAFEPPPKPAELLDAETARADAQRAHQAAIAALNAAASAWREAQNGARIAVLSRAEIAALETAIDHRSAELNAARKAADECSLVWRREYAKSLRAAMWPVRESLHAQAREIRAAAAALGEASARATSSKVGSVWISRNADDFVALAERLASAVDFDKKLGGP